MNRLLFLLIIGIVAACSPANRKKEEDFGDFSIRVPDNWSKVSKSGIDSKVTFLTTNALDTVFINYGNSIRGFNNTVKVHSLQSKIHFDSIDWPYRNEMIFSRDATTEERQGIYLNEYYRYDTINGKRAKIMLPKIAGSGSTGIHFDSLNARGENLTIVGNNLDQKVQDQLYESFYTIIFNEN